MISLIHQQKTMLERSVKAASLYVSTRTLTDATSTKNSQSWADSQLLEALKQAEDDLNLSGELHILRLENKVPVVVVSTSSNFKKGDHLSWSAGRVQGLLSGVVTSTGLVNERGSYWMGAQTSLPSENPDETLYLAFDAQSSSFFYLLLSYGLHYLLIGICMGVGAFILYVIATNKTQKALTALDARFTTLYNGIQDSALLLDDAGRVVSLNISAQRLLQSTPEKLLGRNCFVPGESHFSFIPLDNSKNILKVTLERTQQMGGRAKIVFDSDLVRYVDFSATPVEVGNGIGVLVILRDISFEALKDSRLTTDPLTKTYNRQYLLQVLEPQSLQNLFSNGCSLLLIDIDRFKNLNDLKGRNYGDIILKQISDFMRTFFRRTDEIIRAGGDEFVVLLQGVRTKEAARIATNFIADVSRQNFGDGDRLAVSVGISELQAGENGKDWLERARLALGEAKQAGGTFRIQSSEALEILPDDVVT